MKSQKRSLFIVPHPDDLEIPCGITVQKLLRLHYEVKIIIVCSGELAGDPIAREAEARSSSKYLGIDKGNISFLRFTQFKMHENRWDIKEKLEHIAMTFKPDLLFIPWIEDVHEDHAVISQLSLVAGRGLKSIYYFPTPSSLNFTPNIIVVGDKEMLKKKVGAIKLHKTQVESGRINPDLAISSSAYWLQSFGHHTRNSLNGVTTNASAEVFRLFKEELLG